MTQEEKYYKYLEQIIEERKKVSKGPLEALEIKALLHDIKNKNPELLNIYTPKYQRFLKQEKGEPLLKHLKTLPKGSVVFGKDEKGNLVLLLNKGRKSKFQDVQVEVLDPKILEKNNDEIKKTLFEKVFTEDVRTVEEKLTARDPFEKKFKEMVKQQGASCDSSKTIKNVYHTLSDGQKEDFLFSFQDMSKSSFFNILNTWKDEALSSKKEIKHTKTQTKIRTRIHSREHSIGLGK